ncbi:MAG: winged helix-turn-helix transcriptional regulator [Firmicutes bacterium]|nr:winged helix-turn-helix transcriptional regulator [Bacillota bacterium]
MLTPEECEAVARFLQGFSNPVRIRILCAIHLAEKGVSEIAREIGEKESNISQQLRVLEAKGFVMRRRSGQHVFYRIKDSAICAVMERVKDIILPSSSWPELKLDKPELEKPELEQNAQCPAQLIDSR